MTIEEKKELYKQHYGKAPGPRMKEDTIDKKLIDAGVEIDLSDLEETTTEDSAKKVVLTEPETITGNSVEELEATEKVTTKTVDLSEVEDFTPPDTQPVTKAQIAQAEVVAPKVAVPRSGALHTVWYKPIHGGQWQERQWTINVIRTMVKSAQRDQIRLPENSEIDVDALYSKCSTC